MSKSVVNTVDRPVVRSIRGSTPLAAASAAFAGLGRARRLPGFATTTASPSEEVSARRNDFLDDLMAACCFLMSADFLHPLGCANDFDGLDSGAPWAGAASRPRSRDARLGAPARGPAGAPPRPVISATADAGRLGRLASSGLRSESDLPSDAASAIRSASSGVTASVTTVDGFGSPLMPLFLVVARAGGQHEHVADPVRAIGFSSALSPRPQGDHQSTRVPGTTNPATPITSSTFTDMARIPGGIEGGRPAPASAARACSP